MSTPTTVPTVVHVKASASLNEEVAKELKIKDPQEKSLAHLLGDSDEANTTNQRSGQARGH